MLQEVSVQIPATTANLGPGFDCLGLALALYNRVRFVESAGGLSVTVRGEGARSLPADETNLVVQAAWQLFDWVKWRPSGLRIIQENGIPIGSGLGSSAAAVLGGLIAANAMSGQQLSPDALLSLAAELEGHPDNVMPAYHGGLVLTNKASDRWHVEQIQIPSMNVVVVLPGFDLPTAEARAVLPADIPLSDAVFNAGRLGLLIRALETNDYDKLSLAMQDRLHQPYRLPLIPGMPEVFEAARIAGASGVALSGAGPAVVAFAPAQQKAIGEAMVSAFSAAGLTSRMWELSVDTKGVVLTSV